MIKLRDEDIQVGQTKLAINIKLPAGVDFDKLTDVEVAPVFHEISRVIGQRIGVVKVGGFWLVGNVDPAQGGGWSPRYGHRPGEQKRKLSTALANALNMTVVTYAER